MVIIDVLHVHCTVISYCSQHNTCFCITISEDGMLIVNRFLCEFLGPDDAETFEMELSGFLREYGM